MRIFKFVCLLPLLLLVTSGLSSHQQKPPKQDSIPAQIEIIAKKKTDRQIDSIYHQGVITPVVDALKNNFNELRSHIDTQNVKLIKMTMDNEELSFKRDSILHSKIALSIENQKLIIENKQYKEDINLLTKMPNILMLLIVVIAGSLVSKGIVIGVKNINNEK